MNGARERLPNRRASLTFEIMAGAQGRPSGPAGVSLDILTADGGGGR
jgi:hypothetical protein